MHSLSKFKSKLFKFGSKNKTIKISKSETRPINNDLKSGLINKGFNINIDDLEILTIGDRNIQLTKIVKNRNSDPIYMEIRLTINDWNGKKEYAWMDIDDFYISGVSNRIENANSKSVKGDFTNYIKEFVGNKVFYVRGATPYWDKRFTIHDKIQDISICQNTKSTAKGLKHKDISKRKSIKEKKKKKRKTDTRNKRDTRNKTR